MQNNSDKFINDKLLKLSFVVLMFLFFPRITTAQAPTEKEVNTQAQFWISINSTVRLTDNWGFMADFHIRRNNFIIDPSFYFLRLGGVYWLDEKFSFALGGALLWLATEVNTGYGYALGKRIYQQILWRNSIKRIVFLQRIRNEQRWQQVLTPENTVEYIRFTNRVRFLLSGSIQIFNNKKLPKLVISDEILFHFGKEVVYNTFDQNRIFVGINQSLGKGWKYDFGYMLVFQQKYSGYQYDKNNTLRLFFYYSPDLRKKKSKDMPHYPIGGSE